MKKLIALLLIMCTFFALPISVSAAGMKVPGIVGLSRSEEDRNESAKNIKVELLHDDNYKAGIYSFDVSENGSIALAIENHRIYVYDSNGNFQYGYRFQSQGAYGVAFAGENVAIYFVRGDVLAIYDSAGNCVDVQDIVIPDYPDNTLLFRRTSKQHSGKYYALERNVELLDTYARLVITEDGTRNVLYDISTQHTIGIILFIVGTIAFFALVITCIIRQFKKYDSMEGIWYCAELKMQISLDDYQNAFFVENGERILCKCYLSANGRALDVYCREYEHPKYQLGKAILAAEVRHYEDMSMRVYDRKSWQEYTFVRTDKIG